MKIFAIFYLVLVSFICSSSGTPNYQNVVDQAYELYKSDNSGQVANYIPPLAAYSPHLYGIVLITVDGQVYSAGDIKATFPIESLSKVFALSLALKQYGSDEVLKKLGADATGLPYNSVTAIEQLPTRPGNSLVNAGAMATVSLIKANNSKKRWNLILRNLKDYSNNRTLSVNQKVYKAESATNLHNQALAKLLESYGYFYSDTEEAVDLYTRQCSVDISVMDLARMGTVLANGGKSPFNKKQLLDSKLVPKLLAEMATAGLYTTSGSWLYSVGIPAKSGVSGGMIAISPGKFGLGVYSPPIDEFGNTVRGQKAIAYITEQLNANMFSGNNV